MAADLELTLPPHSNKSHSKKMLPHRLKRMVLRRGWSQTTSTSADKLGLSEWIQQEVLKVEIQTDDESTSSLSEGEVVDRITPAPDLYFPAQLNQPPASSPLPTRARTTKHANNADENDDEALFDEYHPSVGDAEIFLESSSSWESTGSTSVELRLRPSSSFGSIASSLRQEEKGKEEFVTERSASSSGRRRWRERYQQLSRYYEYEEPKVLARRRWNTLPASSKSSTRNTATFSKAKNRKLSSSSWQPPMFDRRTTTPDGINRSHRRPSTRTRSGTLAATNPAKILPQEQQGERTTLSPEWTTQTTPWIHETAWTTMTTLSDTSIAVIISIQEQGHVEEKERHKEEIDSEEECQTKLPTKWSFMSRTAATTRTLRTPPAVVGGVGVSTKNNEVKQEEALVLFETEPNLETGPGDTTMATAALCGLVTMEDSERLATITGSSSLMTLLDPSCCGTISTGLECLVAAGAVLVRDCQLFLDGGIQDKKRHHASLFDDDNDDDEPSMCFWWLYTSPPIEEVVIVIPWNDQICNNTALPRPPSDRHRSLMDEDESLLDDEKDDEEEDDAIDDVDNANHAVNDEDENFFNVDVDFDVEVDGDDDDDDDDDEDDAIPTVCSLSSSSSCSSRSSSVGSTLSESPPCVTSAAPSSNSDVLKAIGDLAEHLWTGTFLDDCGDLKSIENYNGRNQHSKSITLLKRGTRTAVDDCSLLYEDEGIDDAHRRGKFRGRR